MFSHSLDPNATLANYVFAIKQDEKKPTITIREELFMGMDTTSGETLPGKAIDAG